MKMAGATAIAVGTANFSNPTVTIEIIEGIQKYMDYYNVKDIADIRGIID